MKIGIIICSRYKDCAGGKCFRSMQNREGAFSVYSKDTPLEVVGYVECGGCPGVNVEYAPAEMIKNGVEVIHLATGMVVGYPPCPRVDFYKKFIEEKYNWDASYSREIFGNAQSIKNMEFKEMAGPYSPCYVRSSDNESI